MVLVIGYGFWGNPRRLRDAAAEHRFVRPSLSFPPQFGIARRFQHVVAPFEDNEVLPMS